MAILSFDAVFVSLMIALAASPVAAEEFIWSKPGEKPLVELKLPAEISVVNKKPLKYTSVREIVEGRSPTMVASAGTFVLPLAKSHRDPEVGKISIEVKSDGLIGLLARWVDGEVFDEYPEYRSRDVLSDDGWIPIDFFFPARRDVGDYTFLVRYCTAGEKLVLRTRLYYPPFVVAGLPQSSLLDLEAPAKAPEALQREAVRAKSKYFVRQRRFEELEELGNRYLAADAMFPSGRYKIRDVRRPFLAEKSTPSRRRLEADVKLLEEWRTKRPESRVARLVLAGALVRLAEIVEGSAEYDGAQVDRLFRSALELLYELEQDGFKHPMLYTALVELAERQEWDDELVDTYVDRSIATGKWCPDTIGEAYALYERRYFGDNEKLLPILRDLLERAITGTRTRYGEAMLVAAVMELRARTGAGSFRYGLFDWKLAPKAFADLQKHFPESELNKRRLFRMACAFGDRELAGPLAKQLGNTRAFDRETWRDEREMRGQLAWADPKYSEGDQSILLDHAISPLRGVAWLKGDARVLAVDELASFGFVDPTNWTEQKWAATDLDQIPAAFYCAADGGAAAIGTYFSELVVVNLEEGVKRPLAFTREHCTQVAVSADKRRLAAASNDGHVLLYELPSLTKLDVEPERFGEFWEPAREFRIGPEYVTGVHFLEGGNAVLGYDLEGRIEVRNFADGKLVRGWNTPQSRIRVGALSPAGDTLITADGKTIRVFDVAAGKQLREFPRPQRLSLSMSISPDGRILAVGDGHTETFQPEKIHLFDLATGKLIKSFAGHKGCVTSLAFSADGKRLASASLDMSLRIWEIPQQR